MTTLSDTGTVKFIAANQFGYKIMIVESGKYYGIQYGSDPTAPSDPAVVGMVKQLGDGVSRTIVTDGSTLSLGDGQFFNIVAVRNWNV